MFWIILSVLVWGLLHSLLASVKAKELARSWFGEAWGRYHRLAYNLIAGLSFLPVLIIAAMTPDRRLYSVALPWSAIMVFIEFLAVGALVMGLRQTGVWEFLGLRQLMGNVPSEQPVGFAQSPQGRLITTGLYRYVRHPLYTAGMILIWLLPVMTVNLLALNLSLTVYVVAGAYFEERKLRRKYDREYSDYALITPMFIPFLKGNKKLR